MQWTLSTPIKIKIAHITTVDLSLRYLLLNQLRDLQASGYEVCAISSPGQNVPVIEQAGIRHYPVRITRQAFTPVADLQSLWRLYQVIRRERFVIVHTHTPKAGIYGRWAAKAAGTPVIVHTSHGFIFHQHSPRLWYLFFSTLERIAAQSCDLIFSVNQEDAETAIRTGIWPAQKVVPLQGGIGVNLAEFNPGRFTAELTRRQRTSLGLSAETPVVGFAGRLVREKGLLDLLAAAAIVCQQVPTARFLIVGDLDPEKWDSLTPRAAADYGVADVCLFLGQRQDMPELYAAMDVLVLPSYREGFPRAPMEASAMQVPCIVTDIRGCREVITHGQNGLIVPLGDVQALADAIIDLLTHPEKARQMGAAGRRIAEQRFDERIVFAQVKAEYARLLRARGIEPPEAAQ